MAQLDGLLVVDKPSGPTSTDCLNRIKRECRQKKIGHAGTLDPMASGVLLVLLGQGTKLASFLTGRSKVYRGRLRLGMTTDTYDIQGEVTSTADASGISQEAASEALLDWTSINVQEVPAYSAAKHKGKPLYELARAGAEVPVKSKKITVYAAEVIRASLPEIEFRVEVSSGTYIRSLAHSLGKRFHCGAVLTELTREASRPFTLADAYGLEEVVADPQSLPDKVLSLSDALPDWPKACLGADEAAKVRNGVRLPTDGQANPGARAMFLDERMRPLALAEAVQDGKAVSWAILRGLW